MPLKLRITVASALRPGDACPPLSDAVVDIWHADADGLYSNVGADLQTENTVGQTFMRGHQVTDATDRWNSIAWCRAGRSAVTSHEQRTFT